MRVIDNEGHELKAEDRRSYVDIKFDVFAELAREKDDFLLAVQQKLFARGYNFATLEWLKNVLRNNPELAMKAICSTSSTSECASYMSSLQKYLDKEQSASNRIPAIATSNRVLLAIENTDNSNNCREDHCAQVTPFEPIYVSQVSQEPESDSNLKMLVAPEAKIASPHASSASSIDFTIERNIVKSDVVDANDDAPNLLDSEQSACIENDPGMTESRGDQSKEVEPITDVNATVTSDISPKPEQSSNLEIYAEPESDDNASYFSSPNYSYIDGISEEYDSDYVPLFLDRSHSKQPASVGSGADLNGSCADNSSKSKLVGPAESKDPSASRSKMSSTEDETTELDVDTDEHTTTSSGTNTFERHTSASNESIADSADASTGLMSQLDCDENLGSKPASKYFDRPPIAACKIPVTIVKFNGPNDILVRRCDLGFTCGEMSNCITDLYGKQLGLQTKLRCSLSNAHVGCPVVFISLNGYKRAIITRIISNVACHIRLVDDGDSLSEIYFDRLTLLPSGFALYPPLITRITLNMADDNKEWNAPDLALMEEVCLQKWKEANFEFSADTELGPRNFACGDLFSKDTHSSLKKALNRCIDKKVVPPKEKPVEVPTKKEKSGMSIFGIDLSEPQIETRGMRKMKARMEKSARLEKKKSLSDSSGARK